jgi:hypothetical protein
MVEEKGGHIGHGLEVLWHNDKNCFLKYFFI